MASFNYTTVEGDRLDLLAVKFYGSMKGITIIAEANPYIPIIAALEIGTLLCIPIIDDAAVVDKSNLPPWKQ